MSIFFNNIKLDDDLILMTDYKFNFDSDKIDLILDDNIIPISI